MAANENGDPGAAAKLIQLKMEHRDLDAAIEALRSTLAADQLQLARLKRRKLRLKDEIALLEDQLVPDIIA
ncbi:YdcH family protein [Allosphingosinicella sp.]|uniref:YdcH family protein n=1 Tax=Allosphingosinicella sp. TaxID=2823234 RepID=UPI002FC19394